MTAASYGVIIPCFNSEETILETLHSVISQSFPPKQVIVVNDGSLDLTEKLVADFIKPYANYQIVTTPNMGLSAARNLGIKMLDDCDFIAFLDSDDIWHESKMELQIKILQKENDFVGICCDFSNFTDDKNNSVRVRHNFYGATQRGILLQASKIWGSGSAVVIRKKPLRDQNIFDPRLRFAEDLDAWCSIRELGEWGFLPDNLVSIRNSSGSMQGKLSHNPEIYLQSFELILEKWKHHLYPIEVFLKRYEVIFFLTRIRGMFHWSEVLKVLRDGKTYPENFEKMSVLPIFVQLIMISILGTIARIYRNCLQLVYRLRTALRNGRILTR